jgi:drug/metabolite transporter (DMT)-like permease
MVATAASAARFGPTGVGLVLTLASAILLSALAVLTQLAYDEGATVGTTLLGRFLLATAILWPLVWAIRSRRPGRRHVVAGIGLGVGYSAHAWLFAESLARLDAGLVDLLVFTYPALVTVGAIVLRRDRWSSRRGLALGAATAGTTLVLVGGLGSIDPLGAALALASALAYATYILTSAGELERTEPLVLTALVTTGAAATLIVAGVARADVSLDLGASTYALIAAIGLVSVAGMASFIAGVSRLGPARASIVSAIQPALTPVLGFAVFADRLGAAQALGGMLVIAGVVILESGARSSELHAALSWLPRRERRRLGRLAGSLELPAGRSIVRQGANAHALFVIERGRATVVRDGREIAGLGPGDVFGEIALLGDGNRTASVLAATDLRLRVLPRLDFARAMRSLPTLARVVRRLSRERLPVPAPAVA